MPEYIIFWNAGYGESCELVEAEDMEEAGRYAYEHWREEAESNADYGVVGLATEDLKQEYDLE